MTKYLYHVLMIKDLLDDGVHTLAYFHEDCNKKKDCDNRKDL